MPEYSREGHRKRMREFYGKAGAENLPDANVLELYLACVIPRKDVKPIAYNLLNEFGSMKNIFDATPEQLVKVKGIGEKTAEKMCNYSKAIAASRHRRHGISLNKISERISYCSKVCKNLEDGIWFVGLNNKNEEKILCDGRKIFLDGKSRLEIAEKFLNNNISRCIMIINAPNEKSSPLSTAVPMYMQAQDYLRYMNVTLIDCIKVTSDGADAISQLPGHNRMIR